MVQILPKMWVICPGGVPHEGEYERERGPQQAGDVGLLRDGAHRAPRHRDQDHYVLQHELWDTSGSNIDRVFSDMCL